MFWNKQKFKLVLAISVLLVAGFLVTSLASYFVSEKTRAYYHSDGILKKVFPTEQRDIWYFRVKDMKDDYEINVDPDLANKDAMTIFINYRVFDYNGNYIGATGVGMTVSSVKELIEVYQKRIETLRGIVPICSYCKQIRDDKGYWNRVEAYVAKHTEAKFSHSICPVCMEKHFPEENEAIKKNKATGA